MRTLSHIKSRSRKVTARDSQLSLEKEEMVKLFSNPFLPPVQGQLLCSWPEHDQ